MVRGLDSVRRDWCPLVKDVSSRILDAIVFCDAARDADARREAAEAVLSAARDALRRGDADLPSLVITKELSRAPDAYDKAAAGSHVHAARMLAERTGIALHAGETVAYVVCAQGAAVPLKVALEGGEFAPDTAYYERKQLLPAARRLMEVVALPHEKEKKRRKPPHPLVVRCPCGAEGASRGVYGGMACEACHAPFSPEALAEAAREALRYDASAEAVLRLRNLVDAALLDRARFSAAELAALDAAAQVANEAADATPGCRISTRFLFEGL